MRLLLCLLLVGIVLVEAAPVTERRAKFRRMLDELRKKRSEPKSMEKVGGSFMNELKPEEGFQINATWVMPALQEWLTDLFSESSGDDIDEGWMQEWLADLFSESSGDDSNEGWLHDLFTDSSEEDEQDSSEEDNDAKRVQRRHPASKRHQQRHQKKTLPTARESVDLTSNVEDAEQDFENGLGGGNDQLATYLQLIPALLGQNMEDWTQEGQNIGSGSGDWEEGPGGRPGQGVVDEWASQIDWEGMMNDWLQNAGDNGGVGGGRPKPTLHDRKTKLLNRRRNLAGSRREKPNYEQYWQDIDWSSVNQAIQEALDKASEAHKVSRK